MKIAELVDEMFPGEDFSKSKDFIADGLLDSFEVFALIARMNNVYHIEIKGEDIVKENLVNFEAIGKMLNKYGIQNVL